MKETWVNVKGYENFYLVSNQGRLKRLQKTITRKDGIKTTLKEKIVKPWKNDKGYYWVELNSYAVRLHRLVISNFKGYKKNEVNHKNGDKKDNRLINLEYSERHLNINHFHNKLKKQKMYGCYFNKKRQLFHARISVKGKQYDLGFFATKNEACKKYYEAYLTFHKTEPWSN